MRSPGLRWLGVTLRPARHGWWPTLSSLDQGQPFTSPITCCPVASCAAKCFGIARMLGELSYGTLRPFCGWGFGAALGTAFATATTGAAGLTGGTLGSGGRCIIPSVGICTSTHRRHGAANLSRSCAIDHLELEKCPEPWCHGLRRDQAEGLSSIALAVPERRSTHHCPLEVQRGAAFAAQGTKVLV